METVILDTKRRHHITPYSFRKREATDIKLHACIIQNYPQQPSKANEDEKITQN